MNSYQATTNILKVHFIIGKYLYIGRPYVDSLVKELVKNSKKYHPQYIHLMVHIDPTRLYEEMSFLTILECIHLIDYQIQKYAVIMTGTTDKRKQTKADLINQYMSADARLHCPLNTEQSIGPQLLFRKTIPLPLTSIDIFLKRAIAIVV